MVLTHVNVTLDSHCLLTNGRVKVHYFCLLTVFGIMLGTKKYECSWWISCHVDFLKNESKVVRRVVYIYGSETSLTEV